MQWESCWHMNSRLPAVIMGCGAAAPDEEATDDEEEEDDNEPVTPPTNSVRALAARVAALEGDFFCFLAAVEWALEPSAGPS